MKFRQIIYKRLTLYIYQLNSVEYDHEAQFKLLARVLENLRKSSLITDLNIAKAVSELDDAFRKDSNPLRQDLPLKSQNIFIDCIKYVLENNKELIYTILCLTTST